MIRNFSWLIEGEIAGMGRPASSVHDFEFLKDNGFEAIVSLTEFPLNESLIEEFGFEVKHIPIRDFEAPTMEQIEDFVEFAKKVGDNGKKLVVHCDAGIGRTGTILACYLVSKGYNAAKAIEEVRKKRPGSIETIEQEEIVIKYEGKIERK
ncbi:MAG: putative phosphatase [Candidatus Scalindua rubra]|uniref:Putative phosphatase n=1 Tax=Candidatus Scalindua rubra TaxID=1872076 RepID=A0A1E3XDY4_9BACT|nr:MAG: putative phosphatase [Candidatus Scalindua rubra]